MTKMDMFIFLIAFFGGVVAFISPCNIAMLPTFISYVESQVETTRKSIVMSFCFSLGFVFMFTIVAGLFIIISGFIAFIFWLKLISGIIIICLAIYLLLSKKNTMQSQALEQLDEKKETSELDKDLEDILEIEEITDNKSDKDLKYQDKDLKYQGYSGALLLGLSLGSGWIACITPIYLAIVTIAINEQNFTVGMILFFLFALGIIIPYLFIGAVMGRFNERFMVKLVKFGSKIQKIFCVILFLIGVELILSALGIPGILPFI